MIRNQDYMNQCHKVNNLLLIYLYLSFCKYLEGKELGQLMLLDNSYQLDKYRHHLLIMVSLLMILKYNNNQHHSHILHLTYLYQSWY